MITLSWSKDGDFWIAIAHFDLPKLHGTGSSRIRDRATAFALEDLALRLKELE